MRRFWLVLFGLVAGFLLVELGVRSLVRVDGDGQRWLGERRLVPWQLPLAQLADRLDDLEHPDSLLRYDAALGWAPRAGAQSRDGKVSIDATGARRGGVQSAEEVPQLRIVALGDSFAFGDEVADTETWPAQLENLLRQEGRPGEVINLGVNAYGLDQAVLRFERDGVPLDPDVVILGLQPENLMRNLNVLRSFYFPNTVVPLSKPRFVADGEDFALLNQPTLAPGELATILADPGTSDLLAHEWWFDEHYRDSPWYRSHLLALVGSLLVSGDARRASFQLNPEMSAIGNHLVNRLAAAVAQSGARLVLVHTPRREDLESFRQGEAPWYEPWLLEIGQRHELVRPESELGTGDEAFEPGGHYSPAQNRRVAASLLGRF